MDTVRSYHEYGIMQRLVIFLPKLIDMSPLRLCPAPLVIHEFYSHHTHHQDSECESVSLFEADPPVVGIRTVTSVWRWGQRYRIVTTQSAQIERVVVVYRTRFGSNF